MEERKGRAAPATVVAPALCAVEALAPSPDQPSATDTPHLCATRTSALHLRPSLAGLPTYYRVVSRMDLALGRALASIDWGRVSPLATALAALAAAMIAAWTARAVARRQELT